MFSRSRDPKGTCNAVICNSMKLIGQGPMDGNHQKQLYMRYESGLSAALPLLVLRLLARGLQTSERRALIAYCPTLSDPWP